MFFLCILCVIGGNGDGGVGAADATDALCLWMFDFITFGDTKERVSAFISLSQMRFSIFPN